MSSTAEENSFASFRWPLVVIGMLGGHILLMMTAVVLAATIPAAFTPIKGQADGQNAQQYEQLRSAGTRLGWTLEFEPGQEKAANGDRSVRIAILDRTGSPLVVDSISLRIFHHARVRRVINHRIDRPVDMTGVFLPLRREGLWRVEATISSGGESALLDKDFWIIDRKEPNT